MRKNHLCNDCGTLYDCTADECDESFELQCTPCEIKEYEVKNL